MNIPQEVMDRAVEAGCEAYVKYLNPENSWPHDYSETERRHIALKTRAAVTAAIAEIFGEPVAITCEPFDGVSFTVLHWDALAQLPERTALYAIKESK